MIIRNCFRNCLVTTIAILLGNNLGFVLAVGQTTSKKPLINQANSTRKIRVKPSPLSLKAGSAIQWCQDFDAALKKAQSTGKPIFWYVPTIRGTFMDRKSEVDRYMLAGFFSWPDIIAHVNDNFVALMAAPTADQQEKYELSRYKFVEPGFLILAPNGKVRAKVDRLTTQHPAWMLNYLLRFSKSGSNTDLATSRFPELTAEEPIPDQNSDDRLLSKKMRLAMLVFRSGDHEAAKAAWNRIALEHPGHPLAWKAAAEAQGIGPFSRGFEVFVELPQRAFLASIESTGSAAPAKTYSQKNIWTRGTNFLLGMQRNDGGYFDSDYDFGGTDSLANVHVAVTALVGTALLDAREMVDASRADDIDGAIAKCLKFVIDDNHLNRFDRDEILWADAYRVRFIARCCSDGKNSGLDARLQFAVRKLENLQSRRGTWYHEYENAFVTATALIALREAKNAGAKVDSVKVESGLDALIQLRGNDGSYPYYARRNVPGKASNIPASAGRMPLCELALHVWDRSDQSRLKFALEKSFEFHQHLDSALKYDNHTSTYAYGGFFFWYDMRSRTEAVATVQDKELRNKMMKQQLEIIMQLPELDGCFIDSHELGRCYATAMAMLCLKRIHDDLNDFAN